ncbi:MAG: ATP-binding cassette domain-containing protein, partial [Geitlerinemataceae cyanobacterium]
AFEQSQNLLQSILTSISQIYEFNLYISQYFDFLNLQPQVFNPLQSRSFPTPFQSGLELKNVSFTYPGASQPTLKNLNLTVKPGESIALVGTNGAGKTTLLKLLTRLYDIDSGEITFDGIPIDRFELQDLRHNIGIIFQDFARYNLTAQDNIGFGNLPELDNLSLIDRAAENAGAKPTIYDLESGYQTMLGKVFDGGTDLSGGQWQKIGLARAFTIGAPILILDEPTAALDAIAEYELFQKFRQLTQGKMTFFVSHRFSTVLLADRIVVLDNHQIVEVGSHTELIEQNGLYAKMFRLQASSYHV